jgi:hypothetical protein
LLSFAVGWTKVSSAEKVPDQFRELHAAYFDTCMKDWDPATHMTKRDWSRTCRRLADERVKFRLEHSGEFNPKQK